MATIADTGAPTLRNVVSRMQPHGGIETDIAETLSAENPILEDIPWVEGNLPTGHLITSRQGLPSLTWRRLNEGIDPSKSDTAQFTEGCGMLEGKSIVDVDLAELNGNAAAFRASENKAFLESFAQEVGRALFYESSVTNPEKVHGLSARYAASTGYTASSYVLPKGTLSGSNCRSVWLIDWSPSKVYGIFPKASVAGLKHNDHGKQKVRDSNSKEFWAYESQYQWKMGFAVQDYRYAVRMQWDVDDTAVEDADKTMYLWMQEMLGTIYKVGPNTRFYMDRVSKRKLDAQLASNTANFLEYVDMGGKRIPSFMGVPIRVTDCLTAEAAIS